MIEIFNEFFINNGLPALFVLMFINTLIWIPPSEVILPLAGFLAFTSKSSLLTIIIISVLANFLGTYIWYLIGRFAGYSWIFKIKYIQKKVSEKSLINICKKFHKEEAYWVGIFRFFPLLRAVVSIPAGMVKMPHVIFSFYTLIGMTLWNIFWILWGYYLGVSFEYNYIITFLLLGIMILALLIFKIKISNYLKKEKFAP